MLRIDARVYRDGAIAPEDRTALIDFETKKVFSDLSKKLSLWLKACAF